MASSEESDSLNNVPVSEIFVKLWRSFVASEKGSSEALAPEECVKLCKTLIPTLDYLNPEANMGTHEDYSTGELELLLLPCIMAFFEDRSATTDISQRKDCIVRITLLYKFYLKIFRQLHIKLPDGKVLNEDSDDDDDDDVEHTPEYIRNKAVANFQMQRNLFEKIEAQSSYEQDSDATRRDRALNMLRYWYYRSQREIDIVRKELKLLSMGPSAVVQPASTTRAPNTEVPLFDVSASNLRIVRESLRQHVFGLGYPSAPTLTPQEWFDDKMKKEAQHSHPVQQPKKEPRPDDSDAEAEEERRQYNIRMDSWKDEHRRGEGNTYRRG